MKTAVLIFVNVLQVYLIIGILVALIVQPKGLKKIDPAVEGAGTWFRVITFPGVIALWPIVLYKWFTANKN